MPYTNPADVQDVIKRSFTPLTTDEQTVAAQLITDAWFLLIGYKPSVLKLLYPKGPDEPVDETAEANVKRLLGNAVKRVVQNPEGFLEEQGDDYRYRRDSVVSTGELYFTADEIKGLWPQSDSADAFSIRPKRALLKPPLPESAYWDTINRQGGW